MTIELTQREMDALIPAILTAAGMIKREAETDAAAGLDMKAEIAAEDAECLDNIFFKLIRADRANKAAG